MIIRIKYILLFSVLFSVCGRLSSQIDTSKTKLKFDLGFTRTGNVNLWPFFKKTKNSDKKDLQIVFPFFQNKHDYGHHSKSYRFLPFYASDSSSAGIDKRFLTTYYPTLLRFHKPAPSDTSANAIRYFRFLEIAPHISLFEINRSKSGMDVNNNFFFFVWYKKNEAKKKSVFVVFPSYWRFTNKQDTTQLFLPFYYAKKGNGEKHLNIALLYNHHKTFEHNNTSVFPLWFHRESYYGKDTTKTNLLFPLVWTKKSKTEKKRIFFPLVYSFKDEHKKSLTVFPFYSKGKNYDNGSSYYAITPLFWHFENKGEKKNIFFPFVWQKKQFLKDDTIQRIAVLPVFWSKKSKQENNKIVFPIVFKFQNEHRKQITVFPFYSHGSYEDSSRYTAVTPFYWHFENKQEKKNILFPLVWNKTEFTKTDTIYKTKIFPFYWSEKSKEQNRKIFFPLVFSNKTKEKQNLTVFPFFSYGHKNDSSSHLAVTPFFWHFKNKRGQRNVLFPVVWNKTEYTGNDTIHKTKVLPFYYSVRSKDRSRTVIIPFVFQKRDQKKSNLIVFPFYAHGSNVDSSKSYTAVTPFYWSIKNKDEKRKVIFPFYWSKTEYFPNDTIRSRALFPIFWSVKSNHGKKKVMSPILYSYQNKNTKSFTLFPFFSYTHNKDSAATYLAVTPLYWHTKTNRGKSNVIVPFYWSKTKYKANDTITKKFILPVYWSVKSKEKNKKVIFPLVYSFRDKQKQRVTVLPFFSYGHRGDTSSYFAVTPFFWHKENGHHKKNLLFPFYWSKDEFRKDDTIHTRRILPIYWSYRSKKVQKQTFFPIVFKYKDATKERLTVFPFYSAGHRADSSKSYFAVTPFFWHTERKDSKKNVLFPIYWSKQRYLNNDTLKTVSLLPFYWSRKSKTETKKVFFPLVFSTKNSKRESITVFPFYSKGHRMDSTKSHLMITPLFWKTSNNGIVKTQFLPFYFDKVDTRRTDTIHTRSILPFYWSYHSSKKDKKVFFPFVYRTESDRKHQLTVFPFYSEGNLKDGSRSHKMISPFYWKFKTEGGEKTVVFPFYWDKKEKRGTDTVHTRSILPFYWTRTSSKSNKKVFFPFVYKSEQNGRSNLTVFPFYSRGKGRDSSSYCAVTPFFWHTQSKSQKRNVLFPLVWNKTEYYLNDTVKKTSVLPIFFSKTSKNENRKTFFPIVFYRHNQDKQSLTIFPIFSSGHRFDGSRSHLMVTPFFWHTKNLKRERTMLIPFVWNKKTFLANDTVSKTTILPLLTVRKSRQETKVNVLAMLYRGVKRPDYSRVSILWPIIEREKAKGHKSFRFAPFIWTGKTDSTRLFAIEPFFYSYKEKDKSSFILSAYLYKRDNVYGKSVSNSFLWRAWYSKKWTNGDYEHRFLHLIYANVKKEGKREFSLLPFYHKESDTLGNKSKSIFFGFYNRSKEYRKDIKDFYEEERIFWLLRVRSNYRQLKAQGKVFKRH